jgi:hypothetical protein
MYGGKLKLSILPPNLHTWCEILVIFTHCINHLIFLVLLKCVVSEKCVLYNKEIRDNTTVSSHNAIKHWKTQQ